MAQNRKTVVLISFYDKICLSTRLLSSVLKKAGHETHLVFLKGDRASVIDSFKQDNLYYQMIFNDNYYGVGEDVNPVSQHELNLLVQKVATLKPDVIGISARNPALELSRRVTTLLRKALPNVRYIGGGYGPTNDPETFLQFLDYICLGEGDGCVVDMVAGDDPTTCPNVAWLEDHDFRFNPPGPVTPLDALPYPDWDSEDKWYIDDERLVPLHTAIDVKTYDIFVSKGCPSTCSYCQACQWPRMYKKFDSTMPKVRLRNPHAVVEELIFAKERYGTMYVRFMDSILGWDKKWLFQFLDLYDQKVGLKFFCNTDARFTDESSILRLKQSGLQVTQVGIQSVDETIRKEKMGRNISNRQILDYARMLVKNDIKIVYDIIHWNPYDTHETLNRGIDFLRTLPKADEIAIYQLKIHPGSRMHAMLQKEQPSNLSDRDYTFWAWIFLMVLRSAETDALVDAALKDARYFSEPLLLHEMYKNTLHKRRSKEKWFAARKIEEGETLRSMMLTRKITDQENGIDFEDRAKIDGKLAKRVIEQGALLKWEDLYTSYQER